ASCLDADLARAAERAGWGDSARVFWTRYAEAPASSRFVVDAYHRARAYQRLGELWAEAGDLVRAGEYDRQFVELRAQAEPELQAEVTEVRQRLVSRPVQASESRPPR